jgi:hypothetical protein
MEENLLKVLVKQRQWVFEAFRSKFEQAAKLLADEEHDSRLRNLPVSERTFRRWLAGDTKTLPQPDYGRVLERLFDRPVAELFSAAPLTATLNLSLPAERSESATLVAPNRRLLVPGQATRTADLKGQIEMAAHRATRFAAMAEGSNVGGATLETIQQELRYLASAYTQRPLAALLGDLIEVQDMTFELLEGRQRPEQSRELYLLAAVGTGMLAKASHDLGDPRSALAQARAAAVCAENSGHPGMEAWIRGLQSMIAYWAGQHQSAARYARSAQPSANRTAGTARIWIASLEARACAALGDSEGAQAAIRRAEEGWDLMLPDDLDEYGGIMTFTRPRQLYYAADAMVWLPAGDVDSETAAETALAAYESAGPTVRSFSDEAGTRSDLAIARLGRGELEGAIEALVPVLELPVAQRINGIRTSMMHVHEALRAAPYRGATDAAELREEIEGFCQSPAITAIPG